MTQHIVAERAGTQAAHVFVIVSPTALPTLPFACRRAHERQRVIHKGGLNRCLERQAHDCGTARRDGDRLHIEKRKARRQGRTMKVRFFQLTSANTSPVFGCLDETGFGPACVLALCRAACALA